MFSFQTYLTNCNRACMKYRGRWCKSVTVCTSTSVLQGTNLYHRRVIVDFIVSRIASEQLVRRARLSAFTNVKDLVLAYEFKYPTATTKGAPLNLTFSRRSSLATKINGRSCSNAKCWVYPIIKCLVTFSWSISFFVKQACARFLKNTKFRPEKYSSAAPLSANARQRIVCELADLAAALIVSVSVGPPVGSLKERYTYDWRPKEVADKVLSDRSTVRRLNNPVRIESIEEKLISGQTYWYYEYTSQGSPNSLQPEAKETFRHSFSVSAVRPGQVDKTPYLYTFNVTCPEVMWNEVMDVISETVNSFRLLKPTNDFITPEKDPWMFL